MGKHFGLNYNANKMWDAVRFVANQYEINTPEQYLKDLTWRGDRNAKSFLPKLSDRTRIPYEKFSTDVPRTCILIGTLNEITFLNDHTDKRRYLPVECQKENRKKAIYLDKDFQGDQQKKII